MPIRTCFEKLISGMLRGTACLTKASPNESGMNYIRYVILSIPILYPRYAQVIDSSDVIAVVLDSRDPYGTRARHVEKYLRENAPHKHLFFILNKCDLVPQWALVCPSFESVLYLVFFYLLISLYQPTHVSLYLTSFLYHCYYTSAQVSLPPLKGVPNTFLPRQHHSSLRQRCFV